MRKTLTVYVWRDGRYHILHRAQGWRTITLCGIDAHLTTRVHKLPATLTTAEGASLTPLVSTHCGLCRLADKEDRDHDGLP